MAPRAGLFFFFFFFTISLPFATPLSFNFSKFDQSTMSLINLQGDAFFNQVIQLTKNQLGVTITNSTGRAVYQEPLLLWDSSTGEVTDFMAHFTFVINSFNNSLYGDGLTFFLAPFPSILPEDSSGGNLGLLSGNKYFNSLRDSFVAVEFDTFKNEWDPTSDHIGINVNSVKSVATKVWNSSMKDNMTANAWVWYNASTQNLSVFLSYKDNPVFNWTSSVSCTVDMKKILPEIVAIGFSGATGYATEVHNVLSWQFSSNLMVRKKSKVGLVVALAVSVGVAMVVLGLVWFICWRRKAKRQVLEEDMEYDVTLDDEFESGRGPKRFLFSELVDATKNFAKDLKLGEGGFGEVHKGVLTESKLEVAIKRVSAGSKQGKKEYMSEVKIISRLRHRNLVQLVGWCHGHGEFLLVYEYMPNGSLDTHLYSQKKFLAWPVRYKIALGVASALLYLHEEWEQCVVHRDIKPSNVMLDSSFNAKLGDFGLARLVDHDIGSQTTILAGTMGYFAPEIVSTGRASKESDVYSFGIVALEIACGRRPIDQTQKFEKVKLVQWVWDLYGQQMLFEAADERLKMDFDEKEMERLMVVGLWCAHPDNNLRPSIRQVINVLQSEAPLPDLPAKMPVPMFFPPPLDFNNLTFTSSSGASTGMNTRSTGYSTKSSRSAGSSNSSSGAQLLKSPRVTKV